MAELGFATLGNKGRALMVKANIHEKYRYHLFREAFCTATDLDGLVVTEVNGKRETRFFHMFGKTPEWASHLRTFGEAGTVKIKMDTTPKLHDRGVQCMFVGYRMWNPKTRKIHITRDVIFLKRMLFQTTVDEVAVVPSVTQDVAALNAGESTKGTEPTDTGSEMSGGDESEDHSASNPDSDNDDKNGEPNDGMTREWQTTRSGRTSCMPSRYHTEIGAAAINSTKCEINFYSLLLDENEYEYCEEEDEEISCLGAGLGGGFQSTK
jgi:hypothetical protein